MKDLQTDAIIYGKDYLLNNMIFFEPNVQVINKIFEEQNNFEYDDGIKNIDIAKTKHNEE